jgi:hypothetical protein
MNFNNTFVEIVKRDSIQKIINEKAVPFNVFHNLLEDGDLIFSIKDNNLLEYEDINFKQNLFNNVRIVLNKDYLIGYGKTPCFNIECIHQVPIKEYLTNKKEIILIKPTFVNESKKNKMVKYINTKCGNDFKEIKILNDIWNNINNKILFENENDKIDLKEMIFNTTLYSMALTYSGIKENIFVDSENVWPVDILLNNNFDVFCKLDLNESRGPFDDAINKKVFEFLLKKIYSQRKKFYRCIITRNKKKKYKCRIKEANKVISLLRKAYKAAWADSQRKRILKQIENMEERKNKYYEKLEDEINS